DVIDQPKHDDLTAKHDAVVAAKTPAEAAVNNLPEGPEKEALKGRLDAVDGIQVPAVNDTDGNGKPDSQDAQEALDAAEDLVAKAEEAEKVAETDAAGDVIDQPKHDDLTPRPNGQQSLRRMLELRCLKIRMQGEKHDTYITVVPEVMLLQ
ncbi:GA-like domain-containing protein, partial [Escherichia coli]|uniref:GA-like domain-containing protein n=1 Tax=Escherichia coli TaxID=562 RepID=UPI000A9A6F18